MKPGQDAHGQGHGQGSTSKPTRPRDEAEAPPAKPAPSRLRGWLKRVDPFKAGVGLAFGLGLTLGLTAWGVQASRTRTAARHARLDQTLQALATALKAHPEPPFRPTAPYLELLRELTATRSALGQLDPGEGHPDADRQSFLEGELAERLQALEGLRGAVRDPRILADLRRAFAAAAENLAALRKASSLEAAAWEAEVARACAAEGLPPQVLQGAGARLDRVAAACQALEEALGLALLDARILSEPGLEVVSFLPQPDRTQVGAAGWTATGLGHDGRDPGRKVAFALEGSSLVHRLLNAGTWASLARVETGPQGSRRYAVDGACLWVTDQGAEDALGALKAAQALAAAWREANPLGTAPAFTPAPRKTFEDIYTDVEPDPALGTPDGRPDVDHWPTQGEVATLKGAFGPQEDLVLIRHRVGDTPHLWVLAREGVTYTSGGDTPLDRIALLPGGLRLRLEAVEVPAVVGRQSFPVLRVLGRPRVQPRP